MSRGNPYDYCPECNSQNVERAARMIDGAAVSTIHCYHCGGDFRKQHQLRPVKHQPGFETTGVKWTRV